MSQAAVNLPEDNRCFGIRYKDTEDWFCNHQNQVYVMSWEEAKHIMRILDVDPRQPMVIEEYKKGDGVVYDGLLLELEW